MPKWRILITVRLLCLLQAITNVGKINALDEGRFLWSQKSIENFKATENEKNVMKPGRWTRSIFNWLHSPLINSIQEAFEIDSVYENLEPVTKCVKRSISKSFSDLNIEESFENEFFLWEDNEGNPLEFGIKQIKEIKPYRLNKDNVYYSSYDGKSSFWEEPLFYEDNQDVKDVDINHLSYHEKLKLNDLKNRMHSALEHIFPHKTTSVKKSVYYTLSPQISKNDSVTANRPRKDYLKEKKLTNSTNLKTELDNGDTYLSEISNKEIGNEITNTSVSVNNEHSYDRVNFQKYAKRHPTFEKVSALDIKNIQSNNQNSYPKDVHMGIVATEANPIFNSSFKTPDPQNVYKANFKDFPISLEQLFNAHTANLKEEGYEKPSSNKVKNNLNKKPLKAVVMKKSFIDDGIHHRNLRTLSHKGSIKPGRKRNKKHFKVKFPRGHSCQHELSSPNINSTH